MSKVKYIAIFCLSLLVFGESWAMQKYDFNEEKRIEGNISSKELNRIKIEGDRIQQVIGLSKEYVVENDPNNGQIFIKSISLNPKAAVFSIVTESGRTQDFKLSSKDISGETIVVKGLGARNISYTNKGIKHEKHTEIVEAIRYAALNEYNNKVLDKKSISGLEAKQVGIEESSEVVVEIWEVKNLSGLKLLVEEKAFTIGKLGICGVGIEKVKLEPGEETRVYVVRQK